MVIPIFVFRCTFSIFVCVKLACAVFAQIEILDVHAERLSTVYSRLVCNGIGEPTGARTRADDDNDDGRPLPPPSYVQQQQQQQTPATSINR